MGNIPANSFSVKNVGTNGVTCSTRSDPVHGFRVVRELGIVVANSESFTRSSNSESIRIQHAIEQASQKCAALGGNALLGMSTEIKSFGDTGALMVVQIVGTACVIE